MNKWVKQKWLRALRSGEYRKGRNALAWTSHKEYCCLGVLAEEMVPEFIEWGRLASIDGNDGYLPDDLGVTFGLSNDAQAELSRINDRSDDFGPVIDYIENNL